MSSIESTLISDRPRWRNHGEGYGRIAIVLHWLVALTVFGLFGLGLWMVELDYYDPLYRKAPDLHKSIGVTLIAVMLLRLVWRLSNPRPRALGTPLEHRLAAAAHGALYALPFALLVSGYLISTADGRALEVFGLFGIPATITGFDNQEDIAGEVHEWLAYGLIGLVAVHALAALKHHFIDKDSTLKRMLRASN